MPQPLANRTALVTGASSGIGRAAAVALAERGADVAVHYNRNESGAAECVAQVQALGRRATAIQGTSCAARTRRRSWRRRGRGSAASTSL
jgi:NAD(P)-dependent dehydrogenase (short-subunit alcohol dehydrogenase family)